MKRIKLELPEHFVFSTEIPVRITDINYGGHLGNDAILSIIHESRVRFLNEYGFTEFDVGGYGIIMIDSVIVYKSEVFYKDVLEIEVTTGRLGKYGCDIFYKLTNKTTGKEAARAKTGILFFDYEKRNKVRVPEKFKSIFNSS